MTRKEIRALIADGTARDLNAAYRDGTAPDPRDVEAVAISYGTYGMSAGLFRQVSTGDLWAIGDRSSSLFVYA